MLHRHNITRWLKPVARGLKWLSLFLLCVVFIPVIIALGGVGVECMPLSGSNSAEPVFVSAERQAVTAGLSGYARSEDQTYLTLPEWYIVYSADEYAAFIRDNPPSRFPYFSATVQFWQNYYDVCGVTREQYSFNGGYHLSLAIIGVSFTVENILKGLYENTVGRITEWVSSKELTAEDAYARKVATEYGTFLHTVPWYEFPFRAKLSGLWRETPLWGPNIIRKAERKGALSAEYGAKALYGWLIGRGTQGVYAAEDLEIQVWVTGLSSAIMRQEPQIRMIKAIDANSAIVSLPRYEAFTQIVPRLTRQGVQFVEIAGNDEILITVIAPQGWTYNVEAGMPLFALPILTQPERERVAIRVPVAALHQVVSALERQRIALEHIYDY